MLRLYVNDSNRHFLDTAFCNLYNISLPDVLAQHFADWTKHFQEGKRLSQHQKKKNAKIIPFIPCFFLPSTDRIDGPVFYFCTLNSLTAYRRVNKTSLKTLFRLYVSSNFSVLLALILSSIFFRNLRENQYEIMRMEVLTMQTSSLVMPITRSVYHNLKCDFFPIVPDDCTTVKTPGQSSVLGIHHSSPCLADG